MRILSRVQLQQVDDYKYTDIPVPEWGEDAGVRLRTLTSGERSRFESSIFVTEIVMVEGKPEERRQLSKTNLKAQMVGMCLIDESGERLYNDDEIGVLESRNATVINRLFEEAMKLNGMQAKAVEEATKN